MCCGSLSSLAAQLLESYSNFFLGLHQQSPALRHGYWNFKPFILTHLLERVYMFSLVISKMRKRSIGQSSFSGTNFLLWTTSNTMNVHILSSFMALYSSWKHIGVIYTKVRFALELLICLNSKILLLIFLCFQRFIFIIANTDESIAFHVEYYFCK